MNSLMAISTQTKHMAGFAALVATLLTTGGTLALADHYARTAGDAQVYMAGNPPARQAAPAVRAQPGNGRVAAYS
jgi:hypothetical protein